MPSAGIRRKNECNDVTKMLSRRWLFLLFSVVAICTIAAGTWYYRSKCHGMDACAAADAESHERDTPSDPQ